MEEAEAAAVEAPVAAREGRSQPPEPQSTTTNLLASVKEQVGAPPPTPFKLPTVTTNLVVFCAETQDENLSDRFELLNMDVKPC